MENETINLTPLADDLKKLEERTADFSIALKKMLDCGRDLNFAIYEVLLKIQDLRDK